MTLVLTRTRPCSAYMVPARPNRDRHLSKRAFSLGPLGGVCLIAKFGNTGPRDADGLDQAAIIELAPQHDGPVFCACSHVEQCLRGAPVL